MKKGIFFDFDGVITCEKNGSPNILRYISEKKGIPYEKLYNAYMPKNGELLRGRITHKEIWSSFCEEVGQEIEYSILEKAFLNNTLDFDMINYIKELKKDNLIGMITDNKVDRIECILKNTELGKLFDVVIMSADVKSRKTEKKIFEVTLERSSLKSEQCIFIDNTAENLVVPKEMGFQTIYFDDENRNIEEFKNVLNSMIEKR